MVKRMASSHLLVLRTKMLYSEEQKNCPMLSGISRSGRIILIERTVLLLWHYNTESLVPSPMYWWFSFEWLRVVYKQRLYISNKTECSHIICTLYPYPTLHTTATGLSPLWVNYCNIPYGRKLGGKNSGEFGELVKIRQSFFRPPSKLSRQQFCSMLARCNESALIRLVPS